MKKITIPEEGVRGAFVIYTRHLESINFFLNTPLAEDGMEEGRERRTKAIPGHQRRRGPSDQTPINVSQSNADYCYDPTLKSGNALGGRSIVLKTDLASSDIDEQRQFTLVGRALDFQEYFEDKMKYRTHVFFSEGGRHTFLASVNEGG